MTWRKQLLDQAAHLAWGMAAGLVPAVYGAPLWACAVAGVVVALPRELVDQWPVNSWRDTLADTAFFVAGGALAATIV